MNTVHNHFMKRTLHVRKSVPDGIVLCELGRVPLQLYWQKMLLKYIRIYVYMLAGSASYPLTGWLRRLLLMPHL